MASDSLIATLTEALPGKLSLPGSDTYAAANGSYFSALVNDVTPACIAHPTTPADVAAVIKTIRSKIPSAENGKIITAEIPLVAIRGGGHMTFPGSANVQGGVTIDLRGLKGIHLSEDKKSASIAAGESWGDVYQALAVEGLTAAGTRVCDVGATGTVLAGGLSFFSPKKGFSCDSVINFEVVLASGEIVEASRYTNTDLYRALQGGSNNFGVVTRFELEVFPHPGPEGKIWGGMLMVTEEDIHPMLSLFYSTATATAKSDDDGVDDADVGVVILKVPGMVLGAVALHDISGRERSPALRPYTELKHIIAERNTLRHDTHLGFCQETEAGVGVDGNRQLYMTMTVRPSEEFFRTVYARYTQSMDLLLDSIEGFAMTLILSPFTVGILRRSCERWPSGSYNSHGLRPEDGPLVEILLSPVWKSATDDERVRLETDKLVSELKTLAREQGLYHGHIYHNHAWGGHNVLAGYGEERLTELRRASEKWDPQGFFQKVVGGGGVKVSAT